MHPLLPSRADSRHARQSIDFSPIKGERVSGPTDRQGDPHKIKIRAVCRSCNHGWMNSLEQEARPILTPLITGTPTVLEPAHVEIVARWIALKCIVAEHGPANAALTPRADREALKNEGAIPSYFRIYVANHVCNVGSSLHRQSIGMLPSTSSDPSVVLGGMPKNIQTISFLLGRLFIHLNAARIDDFLLEDRIGIIFDMGPFWDISRMWPLASTQPIQFPRRPLIDAKAIDLIAEGLQRYIDASTITWIEAP